MSYNDPYEMQKPSGIVDPYAKPEQSTAKTALNNATDLVDMILGFPAFLAQIGAKGAADVGFAAQYATGTTDELPSEKANRVIGEAMQAPWMKFLSAPARTIEGWMGIGDDTPEEEKANRSLVAKAGGIIEEAKVSAGNYYADALDLPSMQSTVPQVTDAAMGYLPFAAHKLTPTLTAKAKQAYAKARARYTATKQVQNVAKEGFTAEQTADAILAKASRDGLDTSAISKADLVKEIKKMSGQPEVERRVAETYVPFERRSLDWTPAKRAEYKAAADTIRAYNKILASSDPETAMHEQRVATAASMLAKELRLPEEQVVRADIAALGHDLKKLGLKSIIDKQTPLTPDDMAALAGHPKLAADMMRKAGIPESIAQIVEEHHTAGSTEFTSQLTRTMDIADSLIGGPNSGHSYPLRWHNGLKTVTLPRTAANVLKVLDDMSARGEINSDIYSTYRRMFVEGKLPHAQRMQLEAAGETPWNPTTGANMFAGTKSLGANINTLREAQSRLLSGHDAETVRRETGWFEGPDKKWRYEISDLDAKLKNEVTRRARKSEIIKNYYDVGDEMTVGEMMDHKSLYAAYPEVANIKIKIIDGQTSWFDPKTKEIAIGGDNNIGKMIPKILHEVQHVVQDTEGHASGASVMRMWGSSSARDIYNRLARDRGLPPDDAGKQWGTSIRGSSAQQFMTRQEAAWRAYRQAFGEIESRNVEHRFLEPDYIQRNISPQASADAAAGLPVIVMMGGKELRSVRLPANAQPMADQPTPRLTGKGNADETPWVHGTSYAEAVINSLPEGMAKAAKQMVDRAGKYERGGLVITDGKGIIDDIAKRQSLIYGIPYEKLRVEIAKEVPDMNRIAGRYDSNSGTVYYNIDNFNGPNGMAEVLLHEVSHAANNEALNRVVYNRVMAKPKPFDPSINQADRLKDDIENILYARVRERMSSSDSLDKPTEATAYLISEAIHMGQQAGFSRLDRGFWGWAQTKLPDSVVQVLKQTVANIRAALYKYNVALSEADLTVDDILAYTKSNMKDLAAGRRDAATGREFVERKGGKRATPYEQTPEIPKDSATIENFKPENITSILEKDNWAILTAENPREFTTSPATIEHKNAHNAKVMAQLKKELTDRGIKFTEAQGQYGGISENSLVLFNIPFRDAIEIGRKFGQESILTKEGLTMVDNVTTHVPTDVVKLDKIPDDNFTYIPSTGAIFHVNFDFFKQPVHQPGFNYMSGAGGSLLDSSAAQAGAFGGKPFGDMETNTLMGILEVNRRTSPKETINDWNGIETVKKSLSEFGFVEPITVTVSTVDKMAYVSDGNTRVLAAKELGMRTVPVEFDIKNVPLNSTERYHAKTLTELGISQDQLCTKFIADQKVAGQKELDTHKPASAADFKKQAGNVDQSLLIKSGFILGGAALGTALMPSDKTEGLITGAAVGFGLAALPRATRAMADNWKAAVKTAGIGVAYAGVGAIADHDNPVEGIIVGSTIFGLRFLPKAKVHAEDDLINARNGNIAAEKRLVAQISEAMKQAVPDVKQREEIAVLAENPEFKGRTPQEQKVVAAWRGLADSYYALAKNENVKIGFIEGYVSHIIDREGIPQTEFQKVMGDLFGLSRETSTGKAKFTKERMYPTFGDLEKALDGTSLKIRTKDIAEITKIYSETMTRVIENQKLLNQLQAATLGDPEGRNARLLTTEQIPGYVKLTNPQLLPYYVHPDVAPALRFVFDSRNHTDLVNGLVTLNRATKRINVLGSFFHAKSLLEAYTLAGGPLFKAKGAIDAALKEFKNGGLGDEIDSGMRAGLRVEMPTEISNQALTQVGQLVDYYTSQLIGKKVGAATKVGKTIEGVQEKVFDKFTWDYLHTGLKVATYLRLMEDYKLGTKGKGVPIDQYRQGAASFVNDTFGGLDWYRIVSEAKTEAGRRLALSTLKPSSRDILGIGIFAPDWTFSTVRAMTKALPGGAKNPANADFAKGYAIRTAVLYATVINGVNYALTGHFAWDNKDPTRIELGDGTNMQVVKHSMEFAEWVREPFKTFSNKMGFIPRSSIAMITGEEYPHGPKIEESKLGFMTRQVAPFTARSFQGELTPQAGASRALLGMMGISVYGMTEKQKEIAREARRQRREERSQMGIKDPYKKE